MPPLILRILNAAQKIKHLLKFGDLHKLNGPKLFMFRASGTSNISENFANSEKIVLSTWCCISVMLADLTAGDCPQTKRELQIVEEVNVP